MAGERTVIRSLRLIDFKNFADETLRVGPFTVIVGTNASGKSNIRDAFRFLHGIGRGYTLAEIVGGKYGAGGQVEWVPIRGATNEIVRLETSTSGLPVPRRPGFGLAIELTMEHDTATYSIEASTEINKSGFRITYERLQVAGETSMRNHGVPTETAESLLVTIAISTSIWTGRFWCKSSTRGRLSKAKESESDRLSVPSKACVFWSFHQTSCGSPASPVRQY